MNSRRIFNEKESLPSKAMSSPWARDSQRSLKNHFDWHSVDVGLVVRWQGATPA